MAQNIIEELITNLTKLPGIGRKTAQRLAFFILSMPKEDALSISESIKAVKEKARFCSVCFNISSDDLCSFCSDTTRQRDKICVVEEPSNIVIIEKTGAFKGLYHVLMGVLSPVDDIQPQQLRIKELLERVANGNIEEVIIATNPNTKGEYTAKYIGELLKPFKIKVTRIAYGLPIGSDIEFADEVTLAKSLEGRRDI
ncbi:MAG: recombination mediator RecR [Thermodesulfovibrionales bacterium]|nr:recombination mediator RecR [Thermodesulfovibrionales bacterium]